MTGRGDALDAPAARWARDGFVPALDVLTAAEAVEARARFDALEREVGRDTAEIRLQNRHLDVEFVLSLHDGLLLHASHPNRSDRRRCGLAIRFTTPELRQTTVNSLGTYWRAVLVRGADRFGHFPPVEVPWVV
jgi:hypothetical protein